MTNPCAVFWDIENIKVPKELTVASLVYQIRSTIIKPYNLNETFFFCVCDIHKLPAKVGLSLTNVNVHIVQTYNGVKDSADIKIIDLMRQFVEIAGQYCTIILLSGDADYYGALNELKKLHKISIHLIRLANSFSPKLEQISDYTFVLNNGVLKPIKPNGSPTFFISIRNYPLTENINQVMKGLNAQAIGSIQNSAILYDNSICIGFPTLWDAEKAVGQLNGSRFYRQFIKAELVSDSPLTEILKCSKLNSTKSKKQVKQLTFIKINNSNEAIEKRKITESIACTTQSGIHCFLSRKAFLWIVFLFASDAQTCLLKVQVLYPDAIISDPPIDLNSIYQENPYIVESHEQIVSSEASSRTGMNNLNIAIVKPKQTSAVSKQNESSSNVSSIRPNANLEPAKTKVPVVKRVEPLNAANSDTSDNNNLNMFFRYNCNFVGPKLYYQSTEWSLLYNLFEQLYDLGVKKVIFDGTYYCAHFDCASAYQNALKEMHSRYLGHLEYVNVTKAHRQKVTKKMDRYVNEIPWCLSEELDLYCLGVEIDSQFHDDLIKISKNVLGNQECIFIKSRPTIILFGFPDRLMCINSGKTVRKLLPNGQTNEVLLLKATNDFYESITFQDLAGDAYDLAFLSNQLKNLNTIRRPRIIERISLQRMEGNECNETIYFIHVTGEFKLSSWTILSHKQIAKIFVKFSKVIPLAATASFSRVNLIFNSWYEAQVARHYLNKLTTDEAPYFELLDKVGEVRRIQLIESSTYYFVINDKRKVLEKIVQTQGLINKLNSNPTTTQSTSDIHPSLGMVMMKQLEYFIITTDSELKFTCAMISIIKMNLVRLNCRAFTEFEDKIWVGIGGSKIDEAKDTIGKIKFMMLHEDDEDDFEVGVVIREVLSIPVNVSKMLMNQLIYQTKSLAKIKYADSNVVPLGHFNYNYRKAVGMTTSRYCQLNEYRIDYGAELENELSYNRSSEWVQL